MFGRSAFYICITQYNTLGGYLDTCTCTVETFRTFMKQRMARNICIYMYNIYREDYTCIIYIVKILSIEHTRKLALLIIIVQDTMVITRLYG